MREGKEIHRQGSLHPKGSRDKGSNVKCKVSGQPRMLQRIILNRHCEVSSKLYGKTDCHYPLCHVMRIQVSIHNETSLELFPSINYTEGH